MTDLDMLMSYWEYMMAWATIVGILVVFQWHIYVGPPMDLDQDLDEM